MGAGRVMAMASASCGIRRAQTRRSRLRRDGRASADGCRAGTGRAM